MSLAPPSSASSASAGCLALNCRAVGEELSRRVAERGGDERLSSVACAFIARLFLLQLAHRRQSEQLQLQGSAEDEEVDADDFDASISLLPPPPSPCQDVELEWSGRRLSASDVDVVVDALLPRLLYVDHPLLSTLLMQVDFELRHQLQTHLARMEEEDRATAQLQRVEAAAELRVDAADTRAVSAFYSTLFGLTLHGEGMTVASRADRRVQREVAAAMESVFPLPHLLLQHSAQSVEERKAELSGVAELVLGIRLFNRQLHKGGEGLTCTAEGVAQLNAELQADIDREATFIGEIAQAYSDFVQASRHAHSSSRGDERRGGEVMKGGPREEEEKESLTVGRRSGSQSPPSPFSLPRVKAELIHRRQYLLFLHSLQADGATASSSLHALSLSLESLYSQLTAIVGLRSAVSKRAVFPLFHSVGRLYRELLQEESRTQQRRQLFTALHRSRNPFITALTASDIRRAQQVAKLRPQDPHAIHIYRVDPSHSVGPSAATGGPFDFVRTGDDEEEEEGEAEVGVAVSASVLRVTQSSSRRFMALPLVYQGYCCWTLVRRGGFLLAGDPSLGLLRYRRHFFAFAHIKAMRAFAADPARLVAAVESTVTAAFPSLVHLLGLQSRIAHTDVTAFITDAVVQRAYQHLTQQTQQTTPSTTSASASASLLPPLPPSTRSSATQTPTHFPVDDAADASAADGGLAASLSALHWNEWEMRRRAVQMANLKGMRTECSQTHLSHFRRDGSTQYALAEKEADGSSRGRGTQTRVDAATNSERRHVVFAGLRKPSDRGSTRLTPVALSLPPIVHQPTNPDLRH